MMDGVHPEALKYISCCAEIVTTFAPMGAFMGSHFHRQVLAFAIYILDTVSLVRHMQRNYLLNGDK